MAKISKDVHFGGWAVAFSGATDFTTIGPNATAGHGPAVLPRMIFVGGATTALLADETTTVDLPDYGAGHCWPCQFAGIVTGSGIAIW